MVGESEGTDSIALEEQKNAAGTKSGSFLHPVFLNSGKLAAEVRDLSKKTVHLVSQKCTLLNINKGYLAEKLLHTDILYHRKSIEVKPQSSGTNYNLAEALLKNERFHEAALYFKRATLWDFHNVQAHLGAAKAYGKLGQNDRAIEALQNGLTYNEEDADLHYTLGTVYADNGSPTEASDSYKRAIVLRKDFKEALYALTALQEPESDSTPENKEDT